MKRIIAIALGVGVLGTAIYVGSRLWAQGSGTPPAPQPQTRIAVLNFGYVFKSYDKCKNLQDMIASQAKEYDGKIADLKKKLAELQIRYNDQKTTTAEKEQLTTELRKKQHEIQDLQDQANTNLSKAAHEQGTTIMKEIESMTARYAAYKGIELVLHYNDLSATEDRYNPKMLQLRTGPGVCMPLYASPGMDISKDVTDYLNAEYRKAMPQPSTPAKQPQE